jgi:nitrous oxide reductase accessory protein NosL
MIAARRRALPAWLALVLLLAACGDPGEGPARIAWDRDACEHCGMVITDRRFAAQVRIGRTPHRFDDVGCAVEWLGERSKGTPPTEFWVADQESGAWLDARTASFRGGQQTPMGYGFGASGQAGDGSLDLAALEAAVREHRARRRDGGR